MSDSPFQSFLINDRSEVNQLKGILRRLGTQVGLSDHALGKLDIIIAEMASNFFKHANTSGEVLFRVVQPETNPGLEIIGIDHGPGMLDPTYRMQDGVLSTRTLGTGMGAIRRLSDHFDLYTKPGWGTLLLVRLFKKGSPIPLPPPPLEFATLLVAYPGETVCGDGWAHKQQGPTHCFLLTDGLGHGPKAHEASQQASSIFRSSASVDPVALIRALHEQLITTRGTVGMVVSLNPQLRTIEYCGVGNISYRRVSDQQSKHGVSAPGILGGTQPIRLANTSDNWLEAGQLVLHSDGLDQTWRLDDYPLLLDHDRALWSAVLYKDHHQRDDCGILTIRLT